MDRDASEHNLIPWHRLFGLTLTDYFLDTGYEVELEKDLSLKQQLLDVVARPSMTCCPPGISSCTEDTAESSRPSGFKTTMGRSIRPGPG